jgi:hypothetical protein
MLLACEFGRAGILVAAVVEGKLLKGRRKRYFSGR